MGGEYKELIVDISKKEEVYKAADHIRETMGDVSIANKYSDSEGVRRNGWIQRPQMSRLLKRLFNGNCKLFAKITRDTPSAVKCVELSQFGIIYRDQVVVLQTWHGVQGFYWFNSHIVW